MAKIKKPETHIYTIEPNEKGYNIVNQTDKQVHYTYNDGRLTPITDSYGEAPFLSELRLKHLHKIVTYLKKTTQQT